MPVFLDFPIQFFRHLLELLLSVDCCEAVNSDAIREGGLPLSMTVAEVNPLALSQWTWMGFDTSMSIACICR